MTKLDQEFNKKHQKFKQKSAPRFDDEDNLVGDRKAHKRTRRESRQKDDIYARFDDALEHEQRRHY